MASRRHLARNPTEGQPCRTTTAPVRTRSDDLSKALRISAAAAGGIALTALWFGTHSAPDMQARIPAPASSATVDPATHASASEDPISSPLDALLDRLPWGEAALDAPKHMSYGRADEVELLVTRAVTSSDMAAMSGEGRQLHIAGIQLADLMTARLSGSAFAIEELVPERQWVGASRSARWVWRVTPNSEGQQRLHVTLSALVAVGDREAPYVVKQFERDIEVKITAADQAYRFLSKNLAQLAGTAIVVPGLGFFFKAWWERRKKRGPQLG